MFFQEYIFVRTSNLKTNVHIVPFQWGIGPSRNQTAQCRHNSESGHTQLKKITLPTCRLLTRLLPLRSGFLLPVHILQFERFSDFGVLNSKNPSSHEPLKYCGSLPLVIETRSNGRAYAAVLCPSICQICLFSSVCDASILSLNDES